MSVVILKMPKSKKVEQGRPGKCPYCNGEILQRWGAVNKSIKDVHAKKVQVYRYRCCSCQRTFRYYPSGTTRADQTEELKTLAILLWKLGLSYRTSCWILSGLNVKVSFMSIWRDIQAEAQPVNKHDRQALFQITSMGEGRVECQQNNHMVLVAVDTGTGIPLALGYVQEQDAHLVQCQMECLLRQHGVDVILMDELLRYRPLLEN